MKIQNRRQLKHLKSNLKYNYYVINVANTLFYRNDKRYNKVYKLSKVSRDTMLKDLKITYDELYTLISEACVL